MKRKEINDKKIINKLEDKCYLIVNNFRIMVTFFVVFCSTKIVEKYKLRCIMKVLIHKTLIQKKFNSDGDFFVIYN